MTRRTRECTVCPPWVVRCAHLPDGRVLRLSDSRVENFAAFGHTCGKRFTDDGYNLHLNLTSGLDSCIRTADCLALCLSDDCTLCVELGRSLANAEREFLRQEAILLGREQEVPA